MLGVVAVFVAYFGDQNISGSIDFETGGWNKRPAFWQPFGWNVWGWAVVLFFDNFSQVFNLNLSVKLHHIWAELVWEVMDIENLN